jgi:diguanylate cyclase (GGDEF)-like protein
MLAWVAETIQKALRASDILCRYGGEEFLIMATETDIENAKILADRIRRLIEEGPVTVAKQAQIHVTVSLGVSQYREKENYELMISRADKALYQAKENGRNRVCVE